MPRSDQLRLFIVVAETGDFSAAARAMDKKPSFISRSIAQLETELGFSLFVRSTRQMALTDAGVRYYGVCRTLLANLDATARELRGEQRRPLYIQVAASLQGFFMPVLSEFCREFPECRFVINAQGVDADLLILDQAPVHHWPVTVVGGMEWVYAAASSYLQQSPRLIGFSDLDQHTLLLSEEQARGGIYLQQAQALANWHPHNPHILADLHGVQGAVLQGLGVAFLPRPMLAQALAEGALLQVLAPLELPAYGVFCLLNPMLEQTEIRLPLLREKLLNYYRAKHADGKRTEGVLP